MKKSNNEKSHTKRRISADNDLQRVQMTQVREQHQVKVIKWNNAKQFARKHSTCTKNIAQDKSDWKCKRHCTRYQCETV